MDDYGLLFFLTSDPTEEVVRDLETMIDELSSQRNWTAGPPVLVDDVEDSDANTPKMEGQPGRTLGGFLGLERTAHPFDAAKEWRFYQDVLYLVEAIQEFSVETDTEFEFELGGVFVGEITRGVVDECLRVGLLAEWRDTIERQVEGKLDP